jgi:hypothetical protein
LVFAARYSPKLAVCCISTVLVASLAWVNVAQAQVTDCRISTPRTGMQGVDFFINVRNEGYLLVRIADPRFDDMTEVYRLGDCSKLSSGVTAKSTFAQTLRTNQFEGHSLSVGANRQFVNSIYGLSQVKVTESTIDARVERVPAQRQAGLRALKDLVQLKADVQATAIALVANDPMLTLLESSEFTKPDADALPAPVLARSYMDGRHAFKQLEGTAAYKVIQEHLEKNLSFAIRQRLSRDTALAEALDQTFARTLQTQQSSDTEAALAAWRANYGKLREAQHQSLGSIRGYLQATFAKGGLDAAVAAYEQVRDAPILLSDTASRGELWAVLTSAFRQRVQSTPAGPAQVEVARIGSNKLWAAGIVGADVHTTWANTVLAHGNLADTLSFFKASRSNSELRRDTDLLARMRSHLTKRYATDLAGVSGAAAATAARTGQIALAQAELAGPEVAASTLATLRRHGGFADAAAIFDATKDWSFANAMQGMARTQEERRALEEIAVQVLPDPSSLFDVKFTFNTQEPQRTEQRHLGVFALYTVSLRSRKSGMLELASAKDAPLRLQYGKYRAQATIAYQFPTKFVRESSVLGNAQRVDRVYKTLSVSVPIEIRPDGSIQGLAAVDFGIHDVMVYQRGSRGGLDVTFMSDNAEVFVTIQSLEAIKP